MDRYIALAMPNIWNNVLDLSLMEFNRPGEFAKARQCLLHTASAQHRELGGAFQRLAKVVSCRPNGNDRVYQRLHDLTGELHALAKRLQHPLRRR